MLDSAARTTQRFHGQMYALYIRQGELEREADAQTQALDSDDHRESVAAFFEKRPPRFR